MKNDVIYLSPIYSKDENPDNLYLKLI